ncbi:MAG: PD-(D/E)XK nuclease family protein [Faecousia sp.]
MGKLKLLLGADWVACREEILSRIAKDVKQEQGGRILMVPELISHDTERRLSASAGDTASRFAEVLSFTRLARRVADDLGCVSENCMDQGGRIVAMAAATRQLSNVLKTCAAVETKPEFLAELVDAVDEFKRCCITAEDLKNAAGQTEGILAQKLTEFSLILEAYDSLCTRGKRDPRDQMNWLLEQLQEGSFAQNHTFYIDGFPDFTRQHLEILKFLIEASPCVTVSLNCDRVKSTAMAFEKAGQTAFELVKCAENAGVDVEIQTIAGRETSLLDIGCSLFQGKLPQIPDSGGILTTVQADSVYEEVQLAAERVMELVRGGCRYRDISVVCTDMALYKSVIQLVFHRCGIPIYQSGTEEILQKTVIATVLSAMEAALGGFEQRDVLRYLKSALSPLDPDTGDLVENYAILWGIRGKRWHSPWTFHPDGLGENWTEDAKARLESLNQARSMALDPLIELAQDFAGAKNVARQTEALYAFLERIHLAQRLADMAEELDAAGDNRSAQILNQLWEILLTALEQLHDVLGETEWAAENFTRLFSLLLSQYDVGTIPPVLDAVMVGPVNAMRCQQEEHLLVLGASEGALPGYGGSSGLLTDQERVALRAMGVTLTGGAMEGIQAEFAEIYGVFCGAGKTVYVSYPGGQASYVYRRLAEMAGGEVHRAPGPTAAMSDEKEAGYYLAHWNAEDAARVICVEPWFEEAKKRTDFSLGQISRENVRRLYGSRLNLSASQIDRQAECRMSYFLKYGLRVKERKEATVDPAEFGTYVHAVLEKTACKVMELGGFHQVSLEETQRYAKEYSDAYISERFSELESERLGYLFRRNSRELEMVVTELWQELKASRFQPGSFETAFGEGGAMPAIEIAAGQMPAALRGFVDRVDIWERGGQHYFRVVDYKTGKKDFDYCDVFNGVGLQMLLYLFALQKSGQAVVGENARAAGVQYFPARAPMVSADGYLTEEEAELARQKEWARKGLLLQDEEVLQAMEPGENPKRMPYSRKKDGTIFGDLADREQLKMLESYIFSWLANMVDDIASGNVEPNPYTRGSSHDACAFCPYGSICHQATVEGRRNYKAMTAQRFWEEVEKEVGQNG